MSGREGDALIIDTKKKEWTEDREAFDEMLRMYCLQRHLHEPNASHPPHEILVPSATGR